MDIIRRSGELSGQGLGFRGKRGKTGEQLTINN